jgi:hypothetical protein
VRIGPLGWRQLPWREKKNRCDEANDCLAIHEWTSECKVVSWVWLVKQSSIRSAQFALFRQHLARASAENR